MWSIEAHTITLMLGADAFTLDVVADWHSGLLKISRAVYDEYDPETDDWAPLALGWAERIELAGQYVREIWGELERRHEPRRLERRAAIARV